MAIEKRGYGQFCPVAIAAEVLTERWTPLVIRELLLGSTRFSDLQRGVPRMSSSLLVRRLRELEFVGIVERRAAASGGPEYHLTPAGRDLYPVVEGMGVWAQRWMRHDLTGPANLNPDLLMWDIRRTVRNPIRPGGRRFVTEFHLAGAPPRQQCWWLVFEPEAADSCYKNPGFAVDLLVETSLRALTQIWLGHISLDRALREDRLRLDGSRQDVAAFRSWFVLSPFAPVGPAVGSPPFTP